MTDYPYDPELPYVVTWEGVESSARFPDYGRATDYAQFSRGKVIDTTPAPKIPADAEFIHWMTAGYYWSNVAARDGKNPNKTWAWDGVLVSEEDLLEQIGDAEVVVLKRA